MSKYSNKKPNNNSCFTTIFQTLICTGNLPTHPSSSSSSSDKILEKPGKIHPFTHSQSNNLNDDSDITALKFQEVQVTSPGIIAKLMGLDSLPKSATITNNNDMLFRSKSLNSLHFLPDFNSTGIQSHRRARTSASFHEHGHKFLTKIDENYLQNDDMQMKEFDSEVGFGCRQKHSKRKDVVLKGVSQKKSGRIKDSGSKKRYDELYYTRSSKLKNSVGKNGVISEKNCVRNKCGMPKKEVLFVKKEKCNRKNNVGSTALTTNKKVDHKQDMCIEVIQNHDLLLSPSPDSVLDHHKDFLPNYSKGERRQIASNSRRKSSPKTKISDNLPQERVPKSKQNEQKCCDKIARKHKLVKEEVEVADKSVEMFGNICKLVEEQIKDSKWVANIEVLKVQFVSELCMDFSQELLDLLLDELVNEIIML